MSRKISYIVLLVLFNFSAHAQKVSRLDVQRADKFFDNYEYAAAARIYERIVKRDSSFNYAKLQLAESYRKMNRPTEALPLYAEVLQDSALSKPEYTLHYAQTLMASERYDDALDLLQSIGEVDSVDERGQNWLEGLVSIEQFFADTALYSIDTVQFNSEGSDYSPALYKDGLVFSSNREKFRLVKRTHGWDDENFQELYYTHGSDSTLSIELFDKVINTRFHEGPMTFYDNDEKVIFTRNNYNGKRPVTAEDETIHLQLYLAERKNNNDRWAKPTSFPFNNSEYSVGHPSIASDESTLYFASNMPGGYGGVDIYVTRYENDTWTDPVNLGPDVNSPGDDMFPFVHDSTLYFSSNGHLGLGGLDLYKIDLFDSVANIKNLGLPLNSSRDDFGLIIDPTDTVGYFTSNRLGGKGSDDIYTFTIHQPKKPKSVTLKGIVVDQRTQEPLGGAEVELATSDSTILTILTQDDGQFEFELDWDQNYVVNASKVNWTDAADSASTYDDVLDNEFLTLPIRELLVIAGNLLNPEDGTPIDNATLTFTETTTGEVDTVTTDNQGVLYFIAQPNAEYDVFLEKPGFFNFRTKVSTGDDPAGIIRFDIEMEEIVIGRAIRIENIYFDLNKDNIRPDAAIELDKIVQMMLDNPTIEIELGSHTDSRGGDPYNLNLSDRRARSSAAYIISKGIDANRIIGKGYGETQLVNGCTNGVPCSAEDHQANRRTEFKVVSF